MNDNVYYGPHKWIVCIIGSDDFAISTEFIEIVEKNAKKEDRNNVNIAILAVSKDPYEV